MFFEPARNFVQKSFEAEDLYLTRIVALDLLLFVEPLVVMGVHWAEEGLGGLQAEGLAFCGTIVAANWMGLETLWSLVDERNFEPGT